MKNLIVLLFVLFQVFPNKIEIQNIDCTVDKISWQDGKIIESKSYPQKSLFSISESDSTMLVGQVNYYIKDIIVTDSVITYIAKDIDDKEFVYSPSKKSLTQKNIKWRSHGLETWFVYTPLNKLKEGGGSIGN